MTQEFRPGDIVPQSGIYTITHDPVHAETSARFLSSIKNARARHSGEACGQDRHALGRGADPLRAQFQDPFGRANSANRLQYQGIRVHKPRFGRRTADAIEIIETPPKKRFLYPLGDKGKEGKIAAGHTLCRAE
jgi:hypothetical protein